MYEKIDKSEPALRKALYESHKHKCVYCGDKIVPKNLQVDHILAKNAQTSTDDEFNKYLSELDSKGFIIDSIENYLPVCPSCNNKKSNRNFNTSNLRYFHQIALEHANDVNVKMAKYAEDGEDFPKYEPTFDCWEEIDFSNQRGIVYAISGYSKSCLKMRKLRYKKILRYQSPCS